METENAVSIIKKYEEPIAKDSPIMVSRFGMSTRLLAY